MHVAILTFGLSVLTLGVSSYPLSGISKMAKSAMTPRDALDAVPQMETIVTTYDSKEAPLVRRKIWSTINGDGGAGIGVSAGPGITVPAQPAGGKIFPTIPNNPQPVTPPVTLPVTPPPLPVFPRATPPVTPSDPTDQSNTVPPLPVNPNLSAERQIRLLQCRAWFYGLTSTKPYYCSNASPAISPGF